jgi:hypothetical protein
MHLLFILPNKIFLTKSLFLFKNKIKNQKKKGKKKRKQRDRLNTQPIISRPAAQDHVNETTRHRSQFSKHACSYADTN